MTAARASISARLIRAIGLLGDRLLERRQRIRVARLEHRLRGLQPLGRIGRHSVRLPSAACDDAAQPVVEPDRREIAGRASRRPRRSRRRTACRRVPEDTLRPALNEQRPSCSASMTVSAADAAAATPLMPSTCRRSCRREVQQRGRLAVRRHCLGQRMAAAATPLMPSIVSSKLSARKCAAHPRRVGPAPQWRRRTRRSARRPAPAGVRRKHAYLMSRHCSVEGARSAAPRSCHDCIRVAVMRLRISW